jgi:Ca2+-binding EF-hand superfamily protein
MNINMLSDSTKHELAEFLMQISKGERQIEMLRQLLSEKPDFDPFTVFRHLDNLKVHSLTPRDFEEFLAKHSIKISDSDAFLLVRQYDSNGDGKLVLDDFFQFCLPATNPAVRKNALIRPAKRITYDVEYSLVRLVEREAYFHRDLEERRRLLSSRPDFSVLSCFQAIISPGSYIEDTHLYTYLSKQEYFVLLEDIDAILRRVDTDGDSKISYTEFLEALLPITTVFVQHKSELLGERSRSLGTISKEDTRTSFNERYSPPQDYFGETSTDFYRRTGLRKYEEVPRAQTMEETLHTIPEVVEEVLKPVMKEEKSSEAQTAFQTPEKAVKATITDELEFATPEKTEIFPKPFPTELPLSEEISRKLEFTDTAQEIKILSDHYLHIIKLEKQKEFSRQDLAQHMDFNPRTVFDSISRDGKVTSENMRSFFQSQGLSLDESSECFLLSDLLEGQELTYEKWLELVLPEDSEYLQELSTKEAYPESYISKTTCEHLYKLIQIVSSVHRALIKEKKILGELPLENVLREVDKDNDGFISIEELRQMMTSSGIFLNSKDSYSLLRYLDKSGYGKISSEDFLKQFNE